MPGRRVYAELVPTHLRSTAVSLVYNITAAVVGVFAPLIVTWRIAVSRQSARACLLCDRGLHNQCRSPTQDENRCAEVDARSNDS
jgi:hypothetical protein